MHVGWQAPITVHLGKLALSRSLLYFIYRPTYMKCLTMCACIFRIISMTAGKMYWILIWKSSGFVPFGANLIHFGPKSGHRVPGRTWKRKQPALGGTAVPDHWCQSGGFEVKFAVLARNCRDGWYLNKSMKGKVKVRIFERKEIRSNKKIH